MSAGFLFCPAFVNRAARRLSRASFRTALLALVPAAGALALAGGTAVPALAAGPLPSCSAGTCTVSLTAPGAGQAFTVPAGVSALSVSLYGGAGGSTSYSGLTASGGDGALVTATLAVTPGETLGVDVGGAGATGDGQSGLVTAGGVNGGGNGFDSGGGGGATDITAAGASLLVAGGGGGAGVAQPAYAGICDGSPPASAPAAGGPGGNADSPGTAGQSVVGTGFVTGEKMEGGFGGAPGTTAGPGAGGTYGYPDTPGSFGACPGDGISQGSPGGSGSGTAGGSGVENVSFFVVEALGDAGGGGGGGGYFGGGAGGTGAAEGGVYPTTAGSGGGGGGASYTAGAGVSGALVTDAGNSGQVNGGNGEAVLSYADPVATGSPSYNATEGHALSVPAATGLLSSAAGTTQESGLTAAAASATTAQGGSVTVNADGSFSYTPASGFAGTDSFGYTVTDPAGDAATGTAVVMVAASNPSPNADLAVSLSCTASLRTGTTGTCSLTVTNHGPSAATRLTLAVVLPPVVSEVLCSDCTAHGSVLTWTQPSLAAGGSISDLVMFKSGSRPGSGLALGAAAASNPDPRPLNNLAIAIITVKR